MSTKQLVGLGTWHHLGLYDSWYNTKGAYMIQQMWFGNTKRAYMIRWVAKGAYMIQYSERATKGAYMIQSVSTKQFVGLSAWHHLGLYDAWYNTKGAYMIQLMWFSNTKRVYMISCVTKVAYMIQYSERDTMGVYMIQLRVNKTVCRTQCMDHLGLYASWYNTNGAYGI